MKDFNRLLKGNIMVQKEVKVVPASLSRREGTRVTPKVDQFKSA